MGDKERAEAKREFPLREALLRSQVKSSIPADQIYKVPFDDAFDLEKSIYFAASIFWRASVHHWNRAQHLMSRAPLPQAVEAHLRCFLLRAGCFPADTSLLLSVSAANPPRPHCNFPQPMKRVSETAPDIHA